jgi:serine/threonine-protein kinase
MALAIDIPGFTVEGRVAAGARSDVYRGRRGQEEVAIKVYRRGIEAAGWDSRVAREKQAQAMAAHPNIAALLDWGRLSDGSPFLVSRWIEGTTLEARLADGPLPWPALSKIVGAVGEALRVIHSAGIVHRDVKPTNIVLPRGKAPAAVLLDFGHSLVSTEGRLTDSGYILGSASYMAPEQAAGRRFDGRADLYALGVVLYRGLAGVLPFSDRAPAEVLRQHLVEPVVPPSRRAARPIPQAAEDLCMWLLAKAPDARVPNARVLGVTLAAIEGTQRESA